MSAVTSSLILLKPDGYKSTAVRQSLKAVIKAEDLDISERRTFLLTPEQVQGIWPVFQSEKHYINRAIYIKYMTSGPSEAIFLQGPDALNRCLSIKKKIRRNFEVCAFENAIHCPADEYERDANITNLLEETQETSVPDVRWPEWSKEGRFGRSLSVSEEEIQNLAECIWTSKEHGGWPSTFISIERKKSATHEVVLRPGDPNSIDYGISAIFNTVEELSFEQAVKLFIEAEVCGGAVITCANESDMTNIKNRLSNHRIQADLVAKVTKPSYA